MPLISLIINADTRSTRDSDNGMFNGVVSNDFLTDGIYNKIKFFEGFDIETIVFIDEHNPLSEDTLSYLRKLCDTVVIRKHTNENSFNDYNYLSAFALARGQYIAHFDQDTAAFTNGKESIQYMLDLLEDYKFVSYPSIWSPNPVEDTSFNNFWWASTRFFICKKETIRITELENCIKEPEYCYEKYGDRPRRCNWTEHFISHMNNNLVYYPQIQVNNYTIFTWERYERYTLRRLNEFSYDKIIEWHNSHPIFYPNNVNA